MTPQVVFICLPERIMNTSANHRINQKRNQNIHRNE